jgi:hypothetical protein
MTARSINNRSRTMQSTNDDPPKICYSIREACRATSLSRSTLYVHISSGRLRVVRGRADNYPC